MTIDMLLCLNCYISSVDVVKNLFWNSEICECDSGCLEITRKIVSEVGIIGYVMCCCVMRFDVQTINFDSKARQGVWLIWDLWGCVWCGPSCLIERVWARERHSWVMVYEYEIKRWSKWGHSDLTDLILADPHPPTQTHPHPLVLFLGLLFTKKKNKVYWFIPSQNGFCTQFISYLFTHLSTILAGNKFDKLCSNENIRMKMPFYNYNKNLHF